jgi:hypothetical protein
MPTFVLPPSYANFYSVSTQVSAALIGLLFVAVSIGTETVFGDNASLDRQLTALSAFTALVNTFFLSFTSILPEPPLGENAIIMGAVALGASLADASTALRSQRRERRVTATATALIIAALYGYEVSLGVAFLRNGNDTAALSNLNSVIIAAYAIGLSRAWQLLGGSRGHTLIGQLRGLIRGRGESASASVGHNRRWSRRRPG